MLRQLCALVIIMTPLLADAQTSQLRSQKAIEQALCREVEDEVKAAFAACILTFSSNTPNKLSILPMGTSKGASVSVDQAAVIARMAAIAMALKAMSTEIHVTLKISDSFQSEHLVFDKEAAGKVSGLQGKNIEVLPAIRAAARLCKNAALISDSECGPIPQKMK